MLHVAISEQQDVLHHLWDRYKQLLSDCSPYIDEDHQWTQSLTSKVCKHHILSPSSRFIPTRHRELSDADRTAR